MFYTPGLVRESLVSRIKRKRHNVSATAAIQSPVLPSERARSPLVAAINRPRRI